jgi:hypothetical protein
MAFPRTDASKAVLRQDGRPVSRPQATNETRCRPIAGSSGEESYLVADFTRAYFLLNNPEFSKHELQLACSSGIPACLFSFASCVDPVASALQSGASSQP